jgi:3-hydroxy-9,10-secoandrosta-1,3,5(10)-triene-9,17-dione monooxygenase
MSGTGSNDIEVQDLFVPAHRVLPLTKFLDGKTEGTALHANPLYDMPLLPFIYNECMGVFSGALRGATTHFEEVVSRRVTSHARTVVKDQQHTHVLVGEAHMNAFAAEALVRDLASETIKCVNAGEWKMPDRLRLKTIAIYITQHCRRSISDLLANAGTSNFHNERPLQRYFRDINTLATHAFWDRASALEQYGRGRLGLEPNHPLV